MCFPCFARMENNGPLVNINSSFVLYSHYTNFSADLLQCLLLLELRLKAEDGLIHAAKLLEIQMKMPGISGFLSGSLSSY
jgi:hypothetical protein